MNITEAKFTECKTAEDAAILGSNMATAANRAAKTLGIGAKGIIALSRNPELFAAFAAALVVSNEGKKIIVNALKQACHRSRAAAKAAFEENGARIPVASYAWAKNQPLVINWADYQPEAANTEDNAKTEETDNGSPEASNSPEAGASVDEVETLRAQLAEANAEIDRLRAALAEAHAKLESKPRKRA